MYRDGLPAHRPLAHPSTNQAWYRVTAIDRDQRVTAKPGQAAVLDDRCQKLLYSVYCYSRWYFVGRGSVGYASTQSGIVVVWGGQFTLLH